MSHSAVRRRSLTRYAAAEVPLQSGLALRRGTAQGLVDIAPVATPSILGVSESPAFVGGEVRVLEGTCICTVRRAAGFTDPVAVGDRLGVGAGGGFVLANGSPPVAIVEEAELTGSGTIAALIAPWVSSLATSRNIARTIVLGEEGPGNSFEIDVGFEPLFWNASRYSVAGPVYTFEKWTHTVEKIPPAPPAPWRLRFTSLTPDAADVGDLIMIEIAG